MANESSAAIPGNLERTVAEHPAEVSESLFTLAAAELDDARPTRFRLRVAFWVVAAICFVFFLPGALPFLGWAGFRRLQRAVKRRRLKKLLVQHGLGEGLAHALTDAVASAETPEGAVRAALDASEAVLEAPDVEELRQIFADPVRVARFDRVRRLTHNGLAYGAVCAVALAAIVLPVVIAPIDGPWGFTFLLGFPLAAGLAGLLGRAPSFTMPGPLRKLYFPAMKLARQFGSLENAGRAAHPLLEASPQRDLTAARDRHGLRPPPSSSVVHELEQPVEVEDEA